MSVDCPHQRRRDVESCAICDLEEERDQLQARVAEPERERDDARKIACDYHAYWMEGDDDSEEWIRWWYHSGEPEWLRPPAWFLEKYPGCLPRQREGKEADGVGADSG